MSKYSIRSKIIAVIAFMLVAMSGLGLLAIRSMQTINDHTVDIAENWLQSVRVLGDLRADINLFRVALRSHVMTRSLLTSGWPAFSITSPSTAASINHSSPARKSAQSMTTGPRPGTTT